MAIDTSIYGLLKPQEMASPMDSAGKAMNLKSLAMQQDKMGQDMEGEKMQQHLQKAAAYGSALEGLAAVPAAQRPQAYAQVRADMLKSGIVTPDRMPEQYDPQLHQMELARYQQSKEGIAGQLAKANLGLTKAHANYFNAQAAKDRKEGHTGKTLPAGEAMKLSQADSALSSMADVDKAVAANADIMGPTSGVSSLWESGKRLVGADNDANRYDTFDALMNQKAQEIGTYLEGGKLTDADVPKYKKMLPARGDTPEVAAAKSQMVQRLLADRRSKDQTTLGQAGYDVGKIASRGAGPDLPDAVAKGSQKKKAGSSLIEEAQAGSFSPDVVEYAHKHKLTPQQAQAIKQARSGGGK